MQEQNFDTRAFGGFDKQQVLDYIARLIEEQEDALTDKQEEIALLQKRLSDLEQQKAKADAAMHEGAESLKEQAEALDAAAGEASSLRQKISVLEQRLKDADLQITQVRAENAHLHEAVDKTRAELTEKLTENEKLAEKARELKVFEDRQAQVQAKLNELLAKAHAKSEEILRAARDRGVQIITQANGVAAATYASCSDLKENINDLLTVTANLQQKLQSPVVNFETHLEDLKQAALNEKKPSELLDSFLEQNLNS